MSGVGAEELRIVVFTVEMAALATAVILVPAVAAAFLLARYRGPGKGALDTLLSLPLVLPPDGGGLRSSSSCSVATGRSAPGSPSGGSRSSSPGRRWSSPPRSWRSRSSCAPPAPPSRRWTRASWASPAPSGAGPVAAFFRVVLPLAWRGVLAGTVLAFSRALGEFGATVLVAGNIPGRTQTLALAIFHDVQVGRDDRAVGLAAVTVGLAFAALWTTEWIVRRRARRDET